MPTSRLTQRRVDNLTPNRKTYDIRDAEIKGFGVRILPSGRKRYFLHSQIDGNRVWYAIGDADDITFQERARTQARMLLALRRCGDEPASGTSDIPFETVAEEVFGRYRWRWKPRTRAANAGYYGNLILSRFGAGRLPISPDKTFCNGLPRSMQRRKPRTARHRFSR